MLKISKNRLKALLGPSGVYKLTHWAFLITGYSKYLSDEKWTKLQYRASTGKKLDLRHPVSYNEKLQWLKLKDHNPMYTELVDKRLVKDYVKKKIGDEYVIPTLAVWWSTDEIDVSRLPEQFVLKTNHSGGNTGVVICKNRKSFDFEKAKQKLSRSLQTDAYSVSREWPYKNVQRCIIAEPYMEDLKTGELRDYKFFCFDGEPKALFVATERQKKAEPCFDFFDIEYNHLDLKCSHPQAETPPEKPSSFDKMIELSKKLSAGLSHVRVDLYEINGKPYFGELTLYHWEGLMPFYPEKWNRVFGDWLKLPDNINHDE